MNTQPPQPRRAERTTRQITLIVTNMIKLGGLFIVVRAVLTDVLQPELFLLAAFMMSGAQVTEGTVLAMIDRFLGRSPPPDLPPPPPPPPIANPEPPNEE